MRSKIIASKRKRRIIRETKSLLGKFWGKTNLFKE